MGDEKERKSFWASIPGILTALAALITAIGGIWYNMPGPEIYSLAATPDKIIIGDSAEIRWRTNVETVLIEPEICSKNGSENCEVSPKKTTTYVLTAEKWGKVKSHNVTVHVLDNPEANITYSPPNPTVNDEITFDASQSKGKSYEWNLGDRSPTSQGEKITHHYSASGTYSVRLTVRNNGFDNSTYITVDIAEPPKANGTFEPENPRVGRPISFDASDSEGEIIDYSWDFGDGHSDKGKSIEYSYSKGGTYDVNLTVRDAQGHSDSKTIEVSLNQYLKADEVLEPGEYLVSRKGKYYAIMQEDGYFGIYRGANPDDRLNYNNGQAKWYWPPSLPPNPPYYATMQDDGNFCVYRGSYPNVIAALWCVKDSVDTSTREYYAIVDDRGQLCIYKGIDPKDQDAQKWWCLPPHNPGYPG